eukprot:m.45398 g.45398  ORF g.45398 m.45398 type:complete len:178 (-) comp10878_c1_seq2:1196-1729(-)
MQRASELLERKCGSHSQIQSTWKVAKSQRQLKWKLHQTSQQRSVGSAIISRVTATTMPGHAEHIQDASVRIVPTVVMVPHQESGLAVDGLQKQKLAVRSGTMTLWRKTNCRLVVVSHATHIYISMFMNGHVLDQCRLVVKVTLLFAPVSFPCQINPMELIEFSHVAAFETIEVQHLG